jgi:phosphate transport system protein
MERHFDEQLSDLNSELLKMAALVEKSIQKSVEALKNRDKQMAKQVFDDDKKIDEMELQIEKKAIQILATQQPMARDLRFVVTTGLKLNSELERIADLAVNISQRAIEIADYPLLKPLIDIPKLTELARNMLKKAIDAYVNLDEKMAQEVILADPEVDALKNSVQHELINDYMLKDGSTAPRAVPLLLVARHLERICDHATNIAEEIIYMAKAKVVKHHLEELNGYKEKKKQS